MKTKRQKKITCMYEVLDALRAALESAEPTKRKALSDTLNAYVEDFPEEYFWATGPQAPVLLYHLMHSIDCEPSQEVAAKAHERPSKTLGEIGKELNG